VTRLVAPLLGSSGVTRCRMGLYPHPILRESAPRPVPLSPCLVGTPVDSATATSDQTAMHQPLVHRSRRQCLKRSDSESLFLHATLLGRTCFPSYLNVTTLLPCRTMYSGTCSCLEALIVVNGWLVLRRRGHWLERCCKASFSRVVRTVTRTVGVLL
jgi:hypothetical protein